MEVGLEVLVQLHFTLFSIKNKIITICLYHNYIGKTETMEEQLRSIVAQLEFTHQIINFEAQGIPFRTYLYVPEVHPLTGSHFCEREDEAHVLKVSHMNNSKHS